MEDAKTRISQSDEGAGARVSVGQTTSYESHGDESVPEQAIPVSGEPEVRNETPAPDLTPAGLRKLRGQYFTVRHIPLTDCGHKMDVITFPRHTNCENCVWQFFNFHPQLVETVDEAWREHGKEFVIRLRGKKFAHLFARYMKTVAYFKEQEKDGSSKESSGDAL